MNEAAERELYHKLREKYDCEWHAHSLFQTCANGHTVMDRLVTTYRAATSDREYVQIPNDQKMLTQGEEN